MRERDLQVDSFPGRGESIAKGQWVEWACQDCPGTVGVGSIPEHPRLVGGMSD